MVLPPLNTENRGGRFTTLDVSRSVAASYLAIFRKNIRFYFTLPIKFNLLVRGVIGKKIVVGNTSLSVCKFYPWGKKIGE